MAQIPNPAASGGDFDIMVLFDAKIGVENSGKEEKQVD
jgi:hypothetical protein